MSVFGLRIISEIEKESGLSVIPPIKPVDEYARKLILSSELAYIMWVE